MWLYVLAMVYVFNIEESLYGHETTYGRVGLGVGLPGLCAERGRDRKRGEDQKETHACKFPLLSMLGFSYVAVGEGVGLDVGEGGTTPEVGADVGAGVGAGSCKFTCQARG